MYSIEIIFYGTKLNLFVSLQLTKNWKNQEEEEEEEEENFYVLSVSNSTG